jgi:hypothetical protein
MYIVTHKFTQHVKKNQFFFLRGIILPLSPLHFNRGILTFSVVKSSSRIVNFDNNKKVSLRSQKEYLEPE